MRVRFGDFVLDTDRRELLRGGNELHLRPKAFELLQILIEKRPKAISQEELYDALRRAASTSRPTISLLPTARIPSLC